MSREVQGDEGERHEARVLASTEDSRAPPGLLGNIVTGWVTFQLSFEGKLGICQTESRGRAPGSPDQGLQQWHVKKVQGVGSWLDM